MGWNGPWPTRTPSTPTPGPGGNPPTPGPSTPTPLGVAVNRGIWGEQPSNAGNIWNEVNNYARQVGGGRPGWTDAGIDAGVINQMLRTMPASDVLTRTKAYYDQLARSGGNPYAAFSGSHDTGQALIRSVLGGYRGTPNMTSPGFVQNRADWLRRQRAAEGLDQWGNPVGSTTPSPAPRPGPTVPVRRGGATGGTTSNPFAPPVKPPTPYTPPKKPPVM